MRKAAGFSAEDWVRLLQAGAWLLLVNLGLRCLGFARMRDALRPRVPTERRIPLTPSEEQLVERTCHLVDVAWRNHPFPVSCLTRSLALQHMLARGGIPTDLRIGVCKEDGRLVAHAWLECAGQTVGNVSDVEARFVPLVSREASR